MRQRFLKDMRSLEEVFGFLNRFNSAEGIDAAASYAITLAVEEFFTNMVKYSGGSQNPVLIEVERTGGTVTVRMEENASAPFDVTRPTQTQFDRPPLERKPGGLGVHLAKELLDDVRYEYAGGISRITLTKQLEK
jgi:anti-sigma regulatory factor (Ser/Thr protein kinase)